MRDLVRSRMIVFDGPKVVDWRFCAVSTLGGGVNWEYVKPVVLARIMPRYLFLIAFRY
jgi:hypothetical protein